MPKMSIKTNILTVFLSLLGFISIALLYSQYYYSKKVAIETTHKTFSIISNHIANHLEKEVQLAKNILIVKSKHKDVVAPISFKGEHPALTNMLQVLEVKENIYAIYMGQGDGSFYEVINLSPYSNLEKKLGAPSGSKWLVMTIIANQKQEQFLDKHFKVLHTRMSRSDFDLFSRPWYKDALGTDKVVNTKPYTFAHAKIMGITYAKKVPNTSTVLGLDYTMTLLNNILTLQKFNDDSEVFIMDDKGKKFASSNFDKDDYTPLINKYLFTALENNEKDTILYYEHNGKSDYAILHPLTKNKGYLGIKIDADTLLKPYRDNIQYSLYVAIIMIIIAIVIVLLSTNMIVKPIRKLIIENTKVGQRRFSEVKRIESNIIEFEALSHSFVLMAESIQAYQKSQEEMLDSIIKLIAEAIDAKSHYTGGHCERVPEVAQLLLDEVNSINEGLFKDFSLTSKDERRAFEIGSWLHDCGKVTTPEYVVDKSTKLETIYNRIHEIRMRFEVLWRDVQLEYMHDILNNVDKTTALEALHIKQERLHEDYTFIASVNIGGEFMDEAKQERVKAIASKEWIRHFDDRAGLGEVEKLRYADTPMQELPATEKLLDDKSYHIVVREHFDFEDYEKEGFKEEVPEYLYNYGEVYNLCIAKGTLTPEERYKINEHVIMSIKMLEKIPFPEQFSNIPEYAGTHHETLIGTGYPRKLSKEDLSIPARIMAIADIFEALTASDRPYKKAKTLSASIKIMSFMVKDRHIDADLFRLFLESGVYKVYAKKYLKDEQIDEVDVKSYLAMIA